MTEKIMNNQPDTMAANIKKSKAKRIGGRVCVYAVLILYAIVIIFPFSIIILTSFKTWQDASSLTFEWIPEGGFVLDGYRQVFTYRVNMDNALPTLIQSFLNTLMYILPPTLIGLFASSISAYAFSKLRFRAKGIMYSLLLATMMIPGAVMTMPSYLFYDAIGWSQGPLPMMIPALFGGAGTVFFMRQFFSGIPSDLIDAGKIDGMS